MTDSSDDQDKMQYVKKDLFQPVSRPWQYRNQNGDDKSTGEDSNHLFMSEPSMSEADSSEHHLRLLSPMESLTDDQSADDDGLPPPPPPPPPRLLTAQSPASPGNTSLSSWESPHINRRIHLHFSPDPRDDRRYNANIYRNFVPPTYHTHPQQARTPDREFVSDNQQSSASEVSSGQRRRTDQFLNDLRMSSEGQVRESAVGANDSFDSSYHVPNYREGMQNVLRLTAATIEQQEHAPSTDTEVAQNIGAKKKDTVVPAVAHDTNANPTDDTIVMTLSASEDEKDTTATPESSRPLDWEQQHSADDEKTAEFKPRVRTRGKIPAHRRQRSFGEGKQPGHRRQRSGDAAAATLSTGSADWKGMGQHKIPLPPVLGEEDDDDDDNDNGQDDERDQERDAGSKNNHSNAVKNTVDDAQEYRIPSNSARDIAQFSKFALGDEAAVVAAAVSRRNVRRPRRDFRSRKKPWLDLDSEESSSLTSNDFSPRFAFYQPNARHTRIASQPIPSLAAYSPSSYSEAMSAHSQPSPRNGRPVPHSIHQPFHFGSYHDSELHFSPQWRNSWGHSEGHHPKHNRANTMHNQTWFQVNSDRPRGFTDDGIGSPSSTFSWLSGKLGGGTHVKKPDVDSESLSLLEKQTPNVETVCEDDQESYEFHSDSESGSSEPIRHFNAHRNREYENEHSLRVVRHFDNPFVNLERQSSRVDRSKFSVLTSAVPEDEKKFPTYICPICKTRQREFFTVSSAPKTFESASGYIAFYFSVYVIAALYLFGLQEGWGKLDCIYFAVITLTTAGLGDFVPTTDGAKIICSVFIYFGVACIGLLLGSYIAGMLDESSSRTARANRIKSCPNCARIQNIKDAAERRHAAKPINSSPIPIGHGHYGTDDCSYEPDSKKVKRQHQVPPHTNMLFSPHSDSVQTADGRSFVMGPVHANMSVDMSPRSTSGPGDPMQQPNLLCSPVLPGYSPHAAISPLVGSARPNNFMGSPMTTQILRRQSHSRHASFDLHASSQFSSSYRDKLSQRKHSADVPATIPENGVQDRHNIPPPPNGGWGTDGTSDADTFDTESTSSDEFSSSTIDENRKHGIQNAKYVFVTLKEALLNSVVIITFGCMGFCFIEGFSVIDSWYFTTVLLTTVGYGDIVPYTKGGKLFATVYILVAGTILLNNMSMISMIPLELRRRRTERAVLEQFGDWLDDAALRELATGPLVQKLNLSYQHPTGLDECTREMFSLAMLVRLGKVTEEDIKQTFAAFRKLDVHNEGVLNSRTIIAGMIQKHRNLNGVQRLTGSTRAVQRQSITPNQSNNTAHTPLFSPTTESWAGEYGSLYGPSNNFTPASYAYNPGTYSTMSERFRTEYGTGNSQQEHHPSHVRKTSA